MCPFPPKYKSALKNKVMLKESKKEKENPVKTNMDRADQGKIYKNKEPNNLL